MPAVCNHQWPTREEAIAAPRADIRLGSCGACGHIWNTAFDDSFVDYTQRYENSLDYSQHFQGYVDWLVASLIERYDLHGKEIIEIGCGNGHFLDLLCRQGNNRGLGFDPNYAPSPGNGETAEGVTIIPDVYSERCAGHEADFICCRHTLEHLSDPASFVTMLRRSIRSQKQTEVFFEVPNVLRTLRDLATWDIIYEHYSYFSSSSLRHLFAARGFDVDSITETYDGQFLCIDVSPREDTVEFPIGHQSEVMEVTASVSAFGNRYRSKVETWRRNLERIERARRRAVVWGGGSKGISFLNTLRAQGQIEYVVDVNPRKEGMYVSGTGQMIVQPAFLKDYKPDVIIVMNQIYGDEIRQIMESLGLRMEFLYA